MIEPRVYRAAFIPALIALVVAMFSFQSRPRPVPQGLAADVLFDGSQAAELAAQIATEHPDRRPGRRGDDAVASLAAHRFRERGFRVERQPFEHAGHELTNVIARRAGRSRRQVVVVAARDAAAVPDGPGSAASTAALLELARVFQGRPSTKTLVLASIDGSTLGEVGARRLVDELPGPELVDALIVVSDLASRTSRGPLVQAWSNDSRRGGVGLQRTASESIRQELGRAGGGTSALGQLARLSFPIGIGSQGVLLDSGYDGLRISGSGELPRTGDGPVEEIDEDALGALGRATLRTVSAIDQGRRPAHGPDSYVLAFGQMQPGWVIGLLAGALLLPALVASIDAFARARRRRTRVLPWMRWLGAWTAPFLAGLATAEVLALAGATPAPPPAPVAPDILPLDGPALGVLGGVAAAMALGLLLARWLAARPDASLKVPDEPGAGVALALVLTGSSTLLWIVNPYAGLLAVPAAHLWMLSWLMRPVPPRRARAALLAAGAVPPALVVVYYLIALSIDPLSGAWYLLLLVTGHSVGLPTAVLACLLLGVSCAAIELIWRTPGEERSESRDEGPSVYGPGAHAGRGSLGGTQSALRR